MSEFAIFERAFTTVTGLFIAGLVWFNKRLLGRVDKLEDELHNHKLATAEKYASKSDLSENFNRLHDADMRIEGKLDKLIAALPKSRAK